MVIWSGWGIVIGLLAIACLVATQLGLNAVMQDDQFYQTHRWPKLLAGLVCAAVSWPVGFAMNRVREREYIDPATGRPVTLRAPGQHSLFFIPVQYWWIIFAILGFVFYFA